MILLNSGVVKIGFFLVWVDFFYFECKVNCNLFEFLMNIDNF